MNLASFIGQRFVHSGRLGRKFWSLPRKLLIYALGDPACSLGIHGRNMQLPLSHSLPGYLADLPLYDRLPRRLSQFVKRDSQSLTVIDVGANIGDTIAAFYTDPRDRFLAIEPDPHFRKFLQANWGSNPNVTIISDLCSSESLQGTFRIQEKNGTASLVPSTDGLAMQSRTLDDILVEHAFAQQADILKVDTDGHDFKVLAGARRLIQDRQPIVLFECAPFGNPNYPQDVLSTLSSFAQADYQDCLIYTNRGALIGNFSLGDLSSIENLLFYQCLTDSLYYDILVMPPKVFGDFHRQELDFFRAMMPVPTMRWKGHR
jgi:FkbM family methyltransferase